MNDDIKKHIAKNYKKENGKVFIIEETTYGYILVIVKTGKIKRHIAFQCNKSSDAYEKIKNLKKHDRVKCRFMIRSTEYNKRWYTNLELKDIAEWKVNEKKLAADERLKKKLQEQKSNNTLFDNC